VSCPHCSGHCKLKLSEAIATSQLYELHSFSIRNFVRGLRHCLGHGAGHGPPYGPPFGLPLGLPVVIFFFKLGSALPQPCINNAIHESVTSKTLFCLGVHKMWGRPWCRQELYSAEALKSYHRRCLSVSFYLQLCIADNK